MTGLFHEVSSRAALRIASYGAALSLSLGLGGCSQRGPETELRPLLEGLGDPTVPVPFLAGELLRVLDEPSRRALKERAEKLSAEAGTSVEVLHVLQPRGLSAHRRVANVEVEDESDTTATLVVQLAPLSRAPAEGAAPTGGTETLKLVARFEEGGWKLSLTELASLIGRVPLVAGSQGD